MLDVYKNKQGFQWETLTHLNALKTVFPIDDNIYAKNYDGNKHMIKQFAGPQGQKNVVMRNPLFRKTKLYEVLQDLLRLSDPEIDQKFYMICNIRPELKYRHGAISSLELMQRLSQ
jgi:hypothetical protein